MKALIFNRLQPNFTVINFNVFAIDRNLKFENMTFEVYAQAAMATSHRLTRRTCTETQVEGNSRD